MVFLSLTVDESRVTLYRHPHELGRIPLSRHQWPRRAVGLDRRIGAQSLAFKSIMGSRHPACRLLVLVVQARGSFGGSSTGSDDWNCRFPWCAAKRFDRTATPLCVAAGYSPCGRRVRKGV